MSRRLPARDTAQLVNDRDSQASEDLLESPEGLHLRSALGEAYLGTLGWPCEVLRNFASQTVWWPGCKVLSARSGPTGRKRTSVFAVFSVLTQT